MDRYRCIKVFFGVLAVLGATDLGIKKENIYGSGCNGEQIKLHCPRYHKIAIKRIYYGAKKDRTCPSSGREWPHPCCKVGRGDCIVTDDTKYGMFNVMCSGYSSCNVLVEPIRADRSCQGIPETDVLTVVYDCIPSSNVKPFCSNDKTVGKTIFLSNENYPTHIKPGDIHCQCVLKTGLSSGINIHAIDVLITKDKYGSKECLQNVSVEDGHGYTKTITCGHSGLYGFRRIFSRNVTNATLTFESKLKDGRGYVWIQAKAADPKDFLTLYCGKSLDDLLLKMEASRSHVIADEKSSTTVSTIDVYSGDDEGVGNGNGNGNGKTESEGKVDKSTAESTSDIGPIIGGIVAALCFLFIIILIILFIQKRRRKKPKENGTGFSTTMFKPNSKTSSSYCKYYYDEEHYSGIKRSPYKLSKYSDVQTETNQKLREAFISPEAVSEQEEFEQTSFGYYQVRRPINKSSTQDDIAVGLCSENRSPVEAKRKSRTLGHVTAMNGPGNSSSNFDRPVLGRGQNKNAPFSQPVAKVTPMHNGNEKTVDISPDDKDLTMEIVITTKGSEDGREKLSSTTPPDKISEPLTVHATIQTPTSKSEDNGRRSTQESEKRNSAALSGKHDNSDASGGTIADVKQNESDESKQQPVNKREKVKPPISKKPSRNVRISGPIGIDSTNVIVAAGQDKPPVILAKPSKQPPNDDHPPSKSKDTSPMTPQGNITKHSSPSKPSKIPTATKSLAKPVTTPGGRTSKITISNPIAVTGTNASVLNAPPVPSKDFSKCLEIKTDPEEIEFKRGSKESSLEPDSAQNSPRRDKGHSPKRAVRPRSVPPQPPMSTFRSPDRKLSPGGSDPSPGDEKGKTQPHSSDDIHGSSIEKLPTIGDFSEDIFTTLGQLQQQRHELSSNPATKLSEARF